MTDEEYLYHAEVKEKSRIAQSAHKAYSKRRRGCRLPADNLTKKELNKMNGPVISLSLNRPLAWAAFRNAPQDMQKEYIKNILSKYAIGPKALANMFKIDVGYCSKYLKSLGFVFGQGHGATRDETIRFFKEFCDADSNEKKRPPEADSNDKKRPPEAGALRLDVVSISFTGAFTPETIAEALAKLFDIGTPVRIDLTASRVADVAL